MSHSPTTERFFDPPVHSFLASSPRRGLRGHQKVTVVPFPPRTLVFREGGDPIHAETVANVLKLVLLAAVILFAVALVQVIVWGLKDRGPWPRKPHLGHWRKWDEDDEE
jgi:hypothetical protein